MRGWREVSSTELKLSPVANTGLPPLTSSGPPPSAETTELHEDGKISRTVTAVP